MERPIKPLTLLTLFVCMSVLTRGLSLGVDVIDLDEASYIVGSWELLGGKLLYTDFADHHPPLTYVYYALAQLLLGRGMMAVRLLTVLVVVPLTAFAASAFFRHDRRGVVAGLLYLVYSAAFLGHDMLAVNCELLLLLPAAWAIVIVREEGDVARPVRVAGVGLLLGLAALFKYQAGFWIVAVAIAVLFASRPSARLKTLPLALTALAVGLVLPLLASYAAFVALGGADGFIYWNVTHNLSYTANPILLTEALEQGLTKFLPFFLTTIGLWWGWRRSMPLLPPYTKVLVSSLVVLSLPPAFLGFRFYPHYFIQLYIPLALAAAPYAAEILRRPLNLPGKLLTSYSLFVLAGFTVANGALYLARNDVYEETRPVFKEAAVRLRADGCFGGTLFVWGYAPMFYYYAELPVASRFVFPESTLVGYVPGNRASASGEVPTAHLINERHWDWLMEDLERNQPTYILDTAPSGLHRWRNYPLRDFPRLWDFIQSSYERVGAVDRVDIYRHRRCSGIKMARGAP